MKMLTLRRIRGLSGRTCILFVSMLIAASLMIFVSLAAFADGSNQAVSGYYNFRAAVDSGPGTGFYITGALELVVTPTTVSGHLCGVSFSPSHCASLSGTNVDGTNITFTVNKLGKSAPLNNDGTFHSDNGHKGSFTGFSGTFSFGASSGHWTAVQGTVPVSTGTWHFSSLVKRGTDKGQDYQGTLTMSEDTNGKITGTYCSSVAGSTCVTVKGTNVEGYLNIDIETPSRLVLRGSFTRPNKLDGQFYIPGTNDYGYWTAAQ